MTRNASTDRRAGEPGVEVIDDGFLLLSNIEWRTEAHLLEYGSRLSVETRLFLAQLRDAAGAAARVSFAEAREVASQPAVVENDLRGRGGRGFRSGERRSRRPASAAVIAAAVMAAFLLPGPQLLNDMIETAGLETPPPPFIGDPGVTVETQLAPGGPIPPPARTLTRSETAFDIASGAGARPAPSLATPAPAPRMAARPAPAAQGIERSAAPLALRALAPVAAGPALEAAAEDRSSAVGVTVATVGAGGSAAASEAVASLDEGPGFAKGPPFDVWVASPRPDAAELDLALDRAKRREVQLRLRLAGFDPRGADGLFGPLTRAAIADWRVAAGLGAARHLDAAALARLEAETEPARVMLARLDAERRQLAALQAQLKSDAAELRPASYRAADPCARDGSGVIVPQQSFKCDWRFLREDLARFGAG